MARFEMNSPDIAGLGAQAVTADVFFQMGLDRSIGRNGDVDRIAAHMWFNLAAARGNRDAVTRRQEMAAEMSSAEVAEAQRQAREWIRCH
ncbi:MAG: hypothetical protein LWW93_10050 [Hyphomicrobiales bacterium]|nr:hypothetical protein [Hyphomicrobiales bacterium]